MVGLNFFRVACTGSHAAVRTFAPAFRACVPAFNGKRPIAIMCHAPMCGVNTAGEIKNYRYVFLYDCT